MKTFRDKTVLITGASRGIGRAFAEELAPLGARLILAARTQSDLEELALILKQKYGAQVHTFTCDLSQVDAPKKLYDELHARVLEVDVLVNNAGFGLTGSFLDYSLEDSENMQAVNMRSLAALSHLFLPRMLERKDGGIINIASTAGFQPVPYMAVYSATKAFVLSFSQALAGECRNTGVTILCLSPGATKTHFHDVAQMDMKRSLTGRRQDPNEVARIGIRAFLKGKQTAMTSPMNFLIVNVVRFLPRAFLVNLVSFFFKRRSRARAK